MSLRDIGIDELLRFGRAYAGLGDSVHVQIPDLLADIYDNLNPNAVQMIEDRLGGVNKELDKAIKLYRQSERDLS